jgi:hypothetical protein
VLHIVEVGRLVIGVSPQAGRLVAAAGLDKGVEDQLLLLGLRHDEILGAKTETGNDVLQQLGSRYRGAAHNRHRPETTSEEDNMDHHSKDQTSNS